MPSLTRPSGDSSCTCPLQNSRRTTKVLCLGNTSCPISLEVGYVKVLMPINYTYLLKLNHKITYKTQLWETTGTVWQIFKYWYGNETVERGSVIFKKFEWVNRKPPDRQWSRKITVPYTMGNSLFALYKVWMDAISSFLKNRGEFLLVEIPEHTSTGRRFSSTFKCQK